MSIHFKFEIINNSGGGDCLFRSIAVCIGKHEDEHANVRRMIVEFIVQNWVRYMEDMIVQHSEEVTYFSQVKHRMQELTNEEIEKCRKEYLQYMNKVGTYGTASELTGGGFLFNFNFSIIQERDRKNVGVKINTINAQYRWVYFLFTGHFLKGHWRVVIPIHFNNNAIYLPESYNYKVVKGGNKQYVITRDEPSESEITNVSSKVELSKSPEKRKIPDDGGPDKHKKLRIVDPPSVRSLWKDLGFEAEDAFENYPYENVTTVKGLSLTQIELRGRHISILKISPGIQGPLMKADNNTTFQILKGNILFGGKLNDGSLSYKTELHIRKGETYSIENHSMDQYAYIYYNIEDDS